MKRKRIGLIYFYDENWIGGAYYIQNLVLSIDKLEDKFKPVITLFSEDDQFEKFKAYTNYPYLNKYIANNKPYSLLDRIINKAFRILFKKNVIDRKKVKVDLLFPLYHPNEIANSKTKYLHWIPDFQEHYLPDFFSKEEIEKRIDIQKKISSQKGALLLLSSHSSSVDYHKFYPEALTRNFIIPFAVSHPPFENDNIEALKVKFKVTSRYFISSNQFWAHKNHIVIIKAVNILRNRNVQVFVIFTGKQHDWRNPDYFKELQNYIEEHDLSDNVRFLGLIDRSEQLLLMKNAEAVLQSSRFEGWSTVIEDAKAMGQLVIASNIDVHVEQLGGNGIFFNPDDPVELANVMERVIWDKPEIDKINYAEHVTKYALDFLSILNN